MYQSGRGPTHAGLRPDARPAVGGERCRASCSKAPRLARLEQDQIRVVDAAGDVPRHRKEPSLPAEISPAAHFLADVVSQRSHVSPAGALDGETHLVAGQFE